MLELNTTPGRMRLVDLPSAIEELGFAPTHVRTLSVYVDTSPPRIRGPAYLLSFRERCRTVPAGVVAEDEDAFEVARARAEHYLADQSVPPTDHAVLLAVEDILRQLERHVAGQRGGATFGVPSRRESEWLPPRRRRRLADGAESP
jgi:hypothetical protein